MQTQKTKPILIVLLMAAFGLSAGAAIYKEVGGIVVVEAEHFDSRTKATDDDHEWKIAPDELSGDEASAPSGQYQNARGGKHMVVVPDSGQNRNNTDAQAAGPFMDYKVQISTTGDYTLYLRDVGYDGSSDSVYVRILELQKDQGGPGPDWYRYNPTPTDSDFDTDKRVAGGAGWDNQLGPEHNDGGGGEEDVKWTISKAGTYTVRIQQREDGNGVDAFVLQLSSLSIPASNVPESKVVGELDTDKDGMPDSWEIKYGLNPNDPSDAAKDCNNNGVTNLDEYKAGLDPCDATKPTILAVSTTDTFDTVKLTFSESLDPATATNPANFTISPSLAVTAAAYKNKAVTLTTAKQTAGAILYTVAVKGVKDLSKNEIAADTKVTFYSYLLSKTGVLKFSYWGNISGTAVDGLTSDARYPATPDLVTSVASFNSRDAFPSDSHENYGATIEGFLTPTESGNYDFFLRSDDASQFFISSDDKESNLAQVAEETGCCDAFHETGNGDPETTQTPIALVAGKKYFVRVIYKEGGGGDYGQVAWRKDTDKTPAGSLQPIPGKFLSSAVDLPVPAEGRLLTQTPAPNGRGIKPTTAVTIVHSDGKTEWIAANTSLKFDGAAVTPTFKKDANVATITYTPSTLLASKSTHTVSLGYADPGGNPATLEWSFETSQYSGPAKDTVKGYPALILGNAQYTPDAGGHTGKAGDYAIDSTPRGGGWVDIADATFLNAGAKNDTLSVSLWVKKYDIANGSAFWAVGTGQDRAFQAHLPWSDDVVYFDTGGGCCDGATQRISANINTLPAYTDDDTFWKKWHHWVFTKKADQKNIYIDGKLFLNGSSSNPITPNVTEVGLLTDGVPGGDYMRGLIDDVAWYSGEVSAADAAKLAGGAAPSTVTGLIGYWPFDDAIPVVTGGKFTGIKVQGGNVVIDFTGSGVQSADTVLGPWTDVSGSSPLTVPTAGGPKFYRFKP